MASKIGLAKLLAEALQVEGKGSGAQVSGLANQIGRLIQKHTRMRFGGKEAETAAAKKLGQELYGLLITKSEKPGSLITPTSQHTIVEAVYRYMNKSPSSRIRGLEDAAFETDDIMRGVTKNLGKIVPGDAAPGAFAAASKEQLAEAIAAKVSPGRLNRAEAIAASSGSIGGAVVSTAGAVEGAVPLSRYSRLMGKAKSVVGKVGGKWGLGGLGGVALSIGAPMAVDYFQGGETERQTRELEEGRQLRELRSLANPAISALDESILDAQLESTQTALLNRLTQKANSVTSEELI